MSNPTSGADLADSAGYFPQIFAAEGSLFDILLKDASAVLIKSYDSVPSLGSDTGLLTRDFTNSRLRIAGSGGTVSIEAGDAAGDDVGGLMRLGGYSGSQAVTMTLDAASINTTGQFKENSKKLTSVVATAATPFAAVTSLDIALPQTLTSTVAWEVELYNMSVAAGSIDITARLSMDGGSTYKAGASDYLWAGASLGAAGFVGATATDSSIKLDPGRQIDAHGTAHDRILLVIRTSSFGTHISYETFDHSGSWKGMGHTASIAGPCTHVRIIASASTITGSYTVRSLRGFGEA